MKRLSMLTILSSVAFLTITCLPTMVFAQLPSMAGTWDINYVTAEENDPVQVVNVEVTVCQYDEYADTFENNSPFIYIPDPAEKNDPIYGFVWPDGKFALFKDGYSKFSGSSSRNFGLEILIGTLNKKGDKFKGRGTGFDSYIPNRGIWTALEINGKRITPEPPTGACPSPDSIFPILPPNFRK